jgi:hypothetical protein
MACKPIAAICGVDSVIEMTWGRSAYAMRCVRIMVRLGALAACSGCALVLGIDDGKPLPDSEGGDGSVVVDASSGADGHGGGGDGSTGGSDGSTGGGDGSVGGGDAGDGSTGIGDASVCHADAAAACGKQTCGQQLDPTCGVWVSCGPACPQDGGGNCTPDAAAACAGACGGAMRQDQCSHTISCYDPCNGATCYQGSCCVAYDPCSGGGCGTFDVCGQSILCACDAGCTFQTCNPTSCKDNCGNTCCTLGDAGMGDAGRACLGPSASCVPDTGEPCCNGACTQFATAPPVEAFTDATLPMPDAGTIYWACP